ncbi:MAG: hypothetical protein P4L63_01515 [Candidatus Pacebacteria bacterium]|nr:hypothetical protein [Candidatus Paceibacterota bacterium]
MITKEQYIESLVKEIEIIKHLAGKIDASKLDYRPTEKQRTTLELLQYLGQFAHTGISAYIAGSQEKYIELAANASSVTFENFISKMDEQAKFVREAVGALSEEDMKRESTIWGNTSTLAMQLMGVLKNAVAYKMQLFLYIKACGNSAINTSNLWAGKDPQPKE